MDEEVAAISVRQTLKEDLGEILLSAMRSAADGAARLVVSVGAEETHVEMKLQPLNSDVDRSGGLALDLQSQIAEAVAVAKVRGRHRRNPAGSYSNEEDSTH